MEILNNSTFLITGATGFIGSLIINHLLEFNRSENTNITIYACYRNQEKITKIKVDENVVLIKVDLTDVNFIDTVLSKLPSSIDYIFHCGATTKSINMISNPVETADGIVIGTRNILELASKLSIKSMVYLSSMEVYGNGIDNDKALEEQQLGDVLLTTVRSCYPMGKRMAEHYCYIYYKEYGIPVKIARLAQIFGKGSHKDDNRVFIEFAKAVIKQYDIVLNTKGTSMGNYCESEDALRALFIILQKGIDGEIYNVVNEENTMTIREMAELVANKIANGNIRVRCEDRDPLEYGYASETKVRLSAKKLRGLGWYPEKKLEEMYLNLIQELISKE